MKRFWRHLAVHTATKPAGAMLCSFTAVGYTLGWAGRSWMTTLIPEAFCANDLFVESV
jgi:hypothetical protein